ncbi:MAG: glucoamylase family protein [Bacteroidia bacterium]
MLTDTIKVTTNTLEELLSPLRQYFLKDTFVRSDINNAPPLRAELLTIEQMGFLAKDLAVKHEIDKKKTPELLLKRLADNEEVLQRVTDLLQEAVKAKSPVAPAGEWLLDNFYLIEEHILVAKRHLPKGYSKGLPKLSQRNGASAGFPRVYDIAIEIISHSDGHLDIHTLNRFIESYQEISELTLGELWAIPIMLRLALLENMRRVAARIAIDRIDANLAHHWADRIIKTAEKNPKNLVLVMADLARTDPPMASAFIAEYSRKLQWKGFNLTLPISWLEQHLYETGDTINGMVLAENQKQAADQVTMTNSINSLRFLVKTDWREFVEAMSHVEHTLRNDAEQVYAHMDFYTRDQYRHAVENIAKKGKLKENDVAKAAIGLARECVVKKVSDKHKWHVGYYLIGDGLPVIEKMLRVRLSVAAFLRQFFFRNASKFYVFEALLLTTLVSAFLISKACHDEIRTGMFIFLSLLSILAASHFSIAIINWIATLRVGPRPLPKMDFSSGIPKDSCTIVVIPTIITGINQVNKLIEDLEVRFLANRDSNLLFGLLTDLKDATKEVLPDDEILVTHVKQKIIELNKKYSKHSHDIFFLFHRPRSWNPVDKIWMGYERKRGKLGEFNSLLKGGAKDRFAEIVGQEKIYSGVKYVITLDSDTQLPRDAAWKLVGLMAHPLNLPVYDAQKKRIVKGYGIIQPRVAISLHGTTPSLYTRMHENDSGIDPYTRLTSDLYHDIFREGSFIGKGIYDVDAFEKVLNNRFPENRILSHDLLEGSYVRCGFASDVLLYEEFPSRYSTDCSRRHRWIRGDWQIGIWSLPWVPDAKRRLHRNAITALSRWKIFDNLRRSLIPVALLLILILSWTILPSPFFWTLFIIAAVILPSLCISAWDIIIKTKEITLLQHFKNVFRNTSTNITQSLFMLVCLPFEAYISLDAIFRTLWRMFISHKNLLEWNPSGFAIKKNENLFTLLKSMWFAPLLSIALFIFLFIYFPNSILLAAPFLTFWILSPAVVNWVSSPVPVFRTKITDDQKKYLRELSRKTWNFFETYVNAYENWLPIDNLQQYPITIIAHRTSPTNIGLSLLANLSAVDFGYITTAQLLERTANTFKTLDKLERYEGHFFNWYDTQSLVPLHPKYISTVDSGNLAGHLLTLRQGLFEMLNHKIIKGDLWDGLYDTIRIIAKKIPAEQQALFNEFQSSFEVENSSRPQQLNDLKNSLERISGLLNDLLNDAKLKANAEVSEWMISLEHQINEWLKEMLLLAPWINNNAVPEKFKGLSVFHKIPSLKQLAQINNDLHTEIISFHNIDKSEEEFQWLADFEKSIAEVSALASERISEIHQLASQCFDFANMQYNFLYDKTQYLLAIGYNADEHHRDTGFYDLLASEARLGIFVAIAQGKISQESWFALGRRLTVADSTPVLISWSGSMFEYLMPNLVMPLYEHTLLDNTCRGSVKKQIEYGRDQGVPWGISESCYNMVDAHLTYQYRAFGVPELGFKRGLGLDLVIAPYASVMALMIDPAASCKNLERLQAKGYEGRYGFFESIDFTPSRLPRAKAPALIQTFMAHHQGMSLLSLTYLLCDQPMQKRFEADPNLQTALLLLQERVPKATGFYSVSVDTEEVIHSSSNTEMRVINSPNTPQPEIQLLSNGSYNVMVTNSGGGYSRWKDIALTRWREDTTCDNWGAFCYIRDLHAGEFWSTTHQPTLKETSHYEAIFSQGRMEFRRTDNEIELHTEIVVSPEDNVEIRRVHIKNHSRSIRKIEITSYSEVVIALPVTDDSHPAFSNLFVQTELIQNQHAIICSRRPRSKDESPPWIFHLMKLAEGNADNISYETDRDKFIGRGNTVADPKALHQLEPLSNSQGSVLDPIISIQYRITIGEEETSVIDIVTGIAESRSECQTLVDKYQDRNFRNRAFELSWTYSEVILRQINATESDAQLYSRLASSVVFTNPALRAARDVLIKNTKGQSSLWSYSISGDIPIVLLEVSDNNNLGMIKQLLQARSYWQLKGLVVDLVIINEDYSGYRHDLQDQIQSLITAGLGNNPREKQGGVFVRMADQVSNEDKILIQAVAKIIISDAYGTLTDHVNRRSNVTPVIPFLVKSKRYEAQIANSTVLEDFQFYNGFGGFSADGNEYVINTHERRITPLPWINVLANANFGTIVTESGPSYTWAENAHGFRLTPWYNDPVTGNCGEAFYIRDEESGHYWSPMPYPALGKSNYVTRHGFGYSIFECNEDGIKTEIWIYVDRDAQIKFTVIKMRNVSGRARTLTVTGYVEWVLDSLRTKSAMHVVTEFNAEYRTLLTRNNYNSEFPNRVAFLDVNNVTFNFTTDRNEFIGRNGTLERPEAMKRLRLAGKHGAGYDPCTAIQVPVILQTGEEREVIFKMGAAKDVAEAQQLIFRFRDRLAVADSLKKVREYWQHTLDSIKIKTPDESLNILTNGWLLYQVIACRLWGRSGFYQSGGAFGFRDQLQDVIAVMHAQPELTREQILLAASRQFKEGDVQHWWHPPQGRGVRTLCSDDLLWLPYTTSCYVNNTHDYAILQNPVSFIEGRLLNVNEESYFDLPLISKQRTSLYDHCKRAITKSLKFGAHGLPLMGSGDWNDGMNMVGIHGQGESVWLAFFLYDILKRFEFIAIKRDDEEFVNVCRQNADELKININRTSWDGEWYRRAYFDDGATLGSAVNEECKIDSISQSWAVLSGAGEPARSIKAMESADKYLVDRTHSLIHLLDPPFDKSAFEPGYIKGYVPGVRENGGQYSHAAIWMIMAVAKTGNNARAWELLNMINPINHGKTESDIAVYKTEPYVMAADVYGVSPHEGRGGWTWYTGSASWMYQLIISSFLGLTREGTSLQINPCVPEDWKSFEINYRYKKTNYHISVQLADENSPMSLVVDGMVQLENMIQLVDDETDHTVTVKISQRVAIAESQI